MCWISPVHIDYRHLVRVNSYSTEVHHGVVIGAQNNHVRFFVYPIMLPAQRPYVMGLRIPSLGRKQEGKFADLALMVIKGFQEPAQSRISNNSVYYSFTSLQWLIASSKPYFLSDIAFFYVNIYRFYVPGPVEIILPFQELLQPLGLPIFYVSKNSESNMLFT
jgi:hypothetical protein